jgi:hypothetical protein
MISFYYEPIFIIIKLNKKSSIYFENMFIIWNGSEINQKNMPRSGFKTTSKADRKRLIGNFEKSNMEMRNLPTVNLFGCKL